VVVLVREGCMDKISRLKEDVMHKTVMSVAMALTVAGAGVIRRG
jgi:hypothetical protein